MFTPCSRPYLLCNTPTPSLCINVWLMSLCPFIFIGPLLTYMHISQRRIMCMSSGHTEAEAY